MRYVYLRLAEVLKKDYRLEKYKKMEKKVLDIVIIFFGRLFNLGIFISYLELFLLFVRK